MEYCLFRKTFIVSPEAAEAARAFDIPADAAASLYAYAPVYRITKDGRDWVLKRTGYPHSGAGAIANWLKELNSRGIRIVCPAAEFAPNPRKVAGDAGPFEWVIYPFVHGRPYSGSIEEIAAAGRLLGSLHREGADLGHDMMIEPTLPFKNAEWVRATAAEATGALTRFAPLALQSWNAIAERLLFEYDALTERLQEVELPLCACPWDFKASGLIYTAPDLPVLVDPDHAGRIPRLFDLAIALLLFHCDLPSAPQRVFSKVEWDIFLANYSASVTLTAEERDLWPDVLRAAWADQALWLLANWPEGWADGHIAQYLLDLSLIDLSLYRISG